MLNACKFTSNAKSIRAVLFNGKKKKIHQFFCTQLSCWTTFILQLDSLLALSDNSQGWFPGFHQQHNQNGVRVTSVRSLMFQTSENQKTELQSQYIESLMESKLEQSEGFLFLPILLLFQLLTICSGHFDFHKIVRFLQFRFRLCRKWEPSFRAHPC